ncbi:glycerol-3-phosphate dehydrogenase [Pararhizobium antarcticum]|uniref:Glycerol-3-phosphate dehydrogenase n=1 Tax=Pararhizobium antarcticum TaxID=1798805 RepID=A0A657LU19_9HYPH|nr:glycerol-3-phosphate dehydrogenase [Pararhizobium antarcticum]OJF97404.1 glycerol-3-phosphate dehydrogenase [Pararhizobium antarcticum]
MAEHFDLAIIGGGINGCGIARDAAGRGLKVYLCEKGDLGGATSSSSTKLLHGGLRYLEHYEFRLVREALRERETLWSVAPHFVRPLRFVLPHTPGMRPKWLLRLGLFIYDHIGGRKRLPPTSVVNFRRSVVGEGLIESLSTGYEYSDCWVEDNRLVIMNAKSAQERGAVIDTHTSCIAVNRSRDGWALTVSGEGDLQKTVEASIVVNAAGPWVNDVVDLCAKRPAKGKVRLVQGSHIVVPKLYAHDRCFIFQNSDNRILFAIPYEEEYTLIGTTDRDFTGDLDNFDATAEEIAYLCRSASRYFRKPILDTDVCWSYSGVRPLYNDGRGAAQQATRDYVLEVDVVDDRALISVFGGKITTYRRLAESVMDKLAPYLPADKAKTVADTAGWTGREALPGGDFPIDAFDDKVMALRVAYPFLGDHATRLFRYYGTRVHRVLGEARSWSDLGIVFGAGLTEAEVNYMVREEWARSARDILFRRSKLGLRLSQTEIDSIDSFLEGKRLQMTG